MAPLCLKCNPGSNTMEDGGVPFKIGRWLERFVAYIIDTMIITVATFMLVFPAFGMDVYSDPYEYSWMNAAAWMGSALLPLAYFTLMEMYTGTTVGRRALRLYVVDGTGNRPNAKSILISNIGKSFLPIIDFLVGAIAFRSTRQRAFSKLGGLYVAKGDGSGAPSAYSLD